MSRILLLEPNQVLGETYSEFLTTKGHQVYWSRSSQGALQLLDGEKVDLAIVELQIAAHNGLEFLYEFRSYNDLLKIPVIIQSVVPKKDVERSLMFSQLEISAYLYKPQTTLAQLQQSVVDIVNVRLV